MNSLVSVIIPLFNRDKFIECTAKSALSQTYHDLELIIVDDGSSDTSLNIVKGIEKQDNRVKVLQHADSANHGQAASINLGLTSAQGEYICVLDSDDYWETTFVSKLVDVLDQNIHIGLVYANGCGVDESGQYLYDIFGRNHVEESNPERILKDCYFPLPCASMVRRELYDQVGGYNEKYRAAQDHDMAIRISEITQLGYVPEKLWSYRRHENSISQQRQRMRWLNGFKILSDAAQRYPYSMEAINKRRAVLHYRMAKVCMRERSYRQLFLHALKAIVSDPKRAAWIVVGKEKLKP